jgi:hypothetical protein
MRCAALVLCVLGSPAFASSKVDPPGPAGSDPIKGMVLAWHDATLFAEPSDTARSLQLATLTAPRKDGVGRVFALRVVGVKGAFVEVEFGGDEDCTGSRVVVPDDITRVRLFVRRGDLAQVLVKPFTKSFEDGTSITLGTGTPLVATDAGTYVASVRGAELELDVPAASVGYAYAGLKSSSVIGGGQSVAIAAGTKATLGDRTFALTGAGSVAERRGNATLVKLEDRCVEARVLVSNNTLRKTDDEVASVEAGSGMGSGSGSMMSLRSEHLLPRLTQLSIGTRAVAIAAKHIYLHAEPTGKQACIMRGLKLESTFDVERTDDKLRLCAPASQVTRELRRR